MKKRILVVDDEENLRLLFREELSQEGYDIVLAANAQEALVVIEDQHPDLVTLDIKMPGKDGIELLRELRDRYRQLPVIMCTAYGDYKQDFQTWAADAYVVKSPDLGNLKTAIRDILSKQSK